MTEDVERLSFEQERLWSLERATPGNPSLVHVVVVHLQGHLEEEWLRRSVGEMPARHPALRSMFPLVQGKPTLQVAPSMPLVLDVLDRGHTPVSDREAVIRACAREEVSRRFAMESGPLVRATLLRFGADDHVLLLVAHAAAFDPRSAQIFLEDLAVMYRRFSTGTSSPPTQPSSKSPDSGWWQRQWLANVGLDAHLTYWKHQLAAPLPVLQLPTDHPRPVARSFRRGSVLRQIPNGLALAIDALAQHESISCATVLLASFYTLLRRYSDQEDVVVGVPASARRNATNDNRIGCLSHPMALRAQLTGGLTVSELLRRVAEVVASGEEHQEVQLGMLLNELRPTPDPSRNPLFQASFDLHYRPTPVRMVDVTMTLLSSERGGTDVDLAMSVDAGAGAGDLSVTFIYSVDLFDESTAARMLEHVLVLLAEMVARPTSTVASLPLLTDSERHQIVVDWNDTRADFPSESCIHHLVAEQAARDPDAIAVHFEYEEMSYGELERRSNQLARYLNRHGVGPDVLVGLCVERAPEIVVGMLGILKAGGAFLPLDPTYPTERLVFMIEDARVPVLLSQQRVAGVLGSHATRALLLDSGWSAVAEESDEPVDFPANARNLAYCIYTSGSTGRPKGVLLEHRGLCNLTQAQIALFAVGPGSRVLQFAGLSFDASVWEVFMALRSGATLCLAPQQALLPGPNLFQLLLEKSISIVTLPPSALSVLPAEELPELRTMIVAGEACPLDLVNRWAPGRRFFNAYGPTEATVCATAAECEAGDRRPSIGRALNNVRLYVLDRGLQPVPVGVPGELYIGGVGLARGYLNRPELTEERFLPDPFTGNPEDRIYKTGDLVKWLPDGSIDYLGRIDYQVKVRGFRIELEEVEAVLARHKAVREVVVIVREDVPGDKRIVAYWTAHRDASAQPAELRAYLKERLPTFMMPSAFVLLDRFPLTHNGKVDRRALPLPGKQKVEQDPHAAEVRMIEGMLAQHPGVRRAIVIVRSAPSGEKRWVVHYFRRPEHAPTDEELVSFLTEKMPGRVPPLTFVRTATMQERICAVEVAFPGNPALTQISRLEFDGALDVKVFRRAFDEVVRRHAVLRTTFPLVGGRPTRSVDPAMTIDMQVLNLSLLPEIDREEDIARQISEEVERGFDIARGPLMRATLIRFAKNKHVLLVVAHRAIVDGPSVRIFLNELVAIYESLLNGHASPFPELPLATLDYARWQRQWLRGLKIDEHLPYWREQLAGELPRLRLLTDKPLGAPGAYRVAPVERTMPASLRAAVGEFAKREGVSVFVTLLSAFYVLLRRYTAQEHVLIGTPVDGRTADGIIDSIGPLSYPLVLSLKVVGEPSFRDVLAEVAAVVSAAEEHRDVPAATLIDALQIPDNEGRHPLFQALFELRGASNTTQIAGLSATEVHIDRSGTEVDIALSMLSSSSGLAAKILYRTDLFNEDTPRRMLDHFERLLTAAVEDPARAISRLPLIGEDERHRILHVWNDTARDYPRNVCIHELVEAHAARAPHAIAAVYEGVELTYAELNARANRLARRLRESGVRADVPVGILVERSLETLVGLLGILKAGGAYVPLDAEHPEERLRLMLEDSGARVLVTKRAWAGKMPFSGALIDITEAADDSTQDASDLPRVTTAESLAYVMFTSGSTGRPKGVAMPHRGVVRLVVGTDYMSLSPSDVVLHASNLSFDVAAFEIWAGLLNGGRLSVMSHETLLSPEAFKARVQRDRVTFIVLPTAIFHQIASAVPDAFRGLRYLIIGGDALDPKWCNEVIEKSAPGRLLNGYGPTENTTASTMYSVKALEPGVTRVPIGKPIANSVAYVLDPWLEPLPPGIAGELYVGGDGLARGYLNNPGLTAERFIKDPFGGSIGGCLYKTGDRARYLTDGTIDFLGRIDHQVKIRGFRVEPGEIEAILGTHPDVREMAVVAREDSPGEKKLVAYASPIDGACLLPADLRDFLQTRLPAFMIPSVFVVQARLPLTPHGKVDRGALPAPLRGAELDGEGFVAPSGQVEETIAELWCSALGLERVSVNASFLELGGHSLAGARIMYRIRDIFGVELPMRALIEAGTISKLAAVVGATRRSSANAASPILHVRRDEPLPLSFAQQQLWLLIQVDPTSPFYNETITIRIQEALDVEVLERSFQELGMRHETMRTSFVVKGGQPMQVVASTFTFALNKVDLRSLPQETRTSEALRLATEEARRPFTLSEAPLIRATLIRLDDEDYSLFLILHHIITDGISIGNVLLSDLATIYSALSRREPSTMRPLSIQYADFAVWQRKTQTAEALEPHIAYWDKKLAGITLLDVPTDRPHPSARAFKGAKFSAPLDRAVIDALKAAGRREGVTLFMTLLAAFQVLLCRHTGQDDIVVGTAADGRTREEFEPLSGFFVNPIVLRTSLTGDPTFRQLQLRAREVTLDAYAHQVVPFEMLVDELRVPRLRSHNPLFQVVFLLDPPSRPLSTGWTTRQRDIDTGTSKADLTLDIQDDEEGTTARFEYDTALFDETTVARMADHYRSILAAVASNAELRVSEVPLLRPEERKQILGWSGGLMTYPSGPCLHSLFEAQVAATPNAQAVFSESSQLNYRELNRRANRLANHLLRLGVGPESRVGICMDRSLDVVIAILGILKAGAAYVPLGPEEPEGRLLFIIQDAKMPVVLTQRKRVERVPRSNANILPIEAVWGSGQPEDDENPTTRVTPDSIAYVMYAPGSGGRLHGVMVSHENVSRAFKGTRELFEFSARDVWTMFHSYTVDLSAWEMWGALLHGGRLVVVPNAATKSPEALYELLCMYRVTVLNLVPSVFRLLMQVEDVPDPERGSLGLRIACIAGETLDFRMLKPWFERHGDTSPRVFNLYGLTGTSGIASARAVRKSDIMPYFCSFIGAPLPDVEIYILDPHMRLSPIGVPGEIFVGGAGLSHGFLSNPEMTAERFVRHPFRTEPGARLYRTCDRARYVVSGDIEFLGRTDQLLKLRGFRIEPKVVEAALVEHPDVREASVLVREDAPGDQRLVAYYVKRTPRVPTTNELRGFLKEKLPEYMIPTVYVTVNAITLISDGRVDRRSLPAPDRNRPSLMPIFRMPNSAVEVLVLGIWTRLLQVDEIGVKDDFFSLGGHSLLAAQMLARVRETFRIDMRHSSFLMREFLENPTIGGLSDAIEMVREATPSVRGRRVNAIDWNAEARLDPSLRFDAPRPSEGVEPRAVLLTGATGFLGAFLLSDLLTQTRADVYCIVRASSEQAAMSRIQKNLERFSTWDEGYRARIIPVVGDLTQLLLGVRTEVFAELAKKIDVIYHNGSLVNFLYPYTALRTPNVGGTREIIRLATHGRFKPVHYVSTIAILSSYGFFGPKRVAEDVPLDHADHLFMGYPESKWVAEKMLLSASLEGLPVSIYRPHDVSGHSVTGAWKTEGFLCSFLKAIFELGVAPNVNLPLDLAPVDYVSRSIVYLSRAHKPSGQIYHLSNPHYKTLPWMVDLAQKAGYPVKMLEHHAWIQKLVDYSAHHPTSQISPFVPLFVERWSDAQLTLLEIYCEERIPAFDCTRTLEALCGSGITCPPVDEEMMNKYLSHFVATGFLPTAGT